MTIIDDHNRKRGTVPVTETKTKICQLLAMSPKWHYASITNLDIILLMNQMRQGRTCKKKVRKQTWKHPPYNSAEYATVAIGGILKRYCGLQHRQLMSNLPNVGPAAGYTLSRLPPILHHLFFDNTSAQALQAPCNKMYQIRNHKKIFCERTQEARITPLSE